MTSRVTCFIPSAPSEAARKKIRGSGENEGKQIEYKLVEISH